MDVCALPGHTAASLHTSACDDEAIVLPLQCQKMQGALGALCSGGTGGFRVGWGLGRKHILREAREMMCG